jgi:hypothetical protein
MPTVRHATGAAVRGLVASGLAVVAGGSALELVDAKRRRKKGKKRGNGGGGKQPKGGQVLPAGAFCRQDAQCDPTHTHCICAVAVNAGNSDETC